MSISNAPVDSCSSSKGSRTLHEKGISADVDSAEKWQECVKPVITQYALKTFSIWMKWHIFIMYNQRGLWHLGREFQAGEKA
jgi:hypothetical protein